MFGRQKAPPRWTTCVSQVNSNMGMALGSMFVKRYFDESSKNDVSYMYYRFEFKYLRKNLKYLNLLKNFNYRR